MIQLKLAKTENVKVSYVKQIRQSESVVYNILLKVNNVIAKKCSRCPRRSPRRQKRKILRVKDIYSRNWRVF